MQPTYTVGNQQLVKMLLQHGADISAESLYSYTALHYAVFNNHTELVEFLLLEGASESVVNCHMGEHPMRLLCMRNVTR
jgi:ankyrin repeat protein